MVHVKPETRLIGFDDGPFTFEDTTASLAGVMARGGGYVEAILCGEVTVDGMDATGTVLDLLDGSGFTETAAAICFDGGTVAGFNVLDLARIHAATGLPTAALLDRAPDRATVEAALRKHQEDAEARMALLEAQPVEPLDLSAGTLHIRQVGWPLERWRQLLDHHIVQGRRPEPLRIAHLVATAMREGRSRGG